MKIEASLNYLEKLAEGKNVFPDKDKEEMCILLSKKLLKEQYLRSEAEEKLKKAIDALRIIHDKAIPAHGENLNDLEMEHTSGFLDGISTVIETLKG